MTDRQQIISDIDAQVRRLQDLADEASQRAIDLEQRRQALELLDDDTEIDAVMQDAPPLGPVEDSDESPPSEPDPATGMAKVHRAWADAFAMQDRAEAAQRAAPPPTNDEQAAAYQRAVAGVRDILNRGAEVTD